VGARRVAGISLSPRTLPLNSASGQSRVDVVVREDSDKNMDRRNRNLVFLFGDWQRHPLDESSEQFIAAESGFGLGDWTLDPYKPSRDPVRRTREGASFSEISEPGPVCTGRIPTTNVPRSASAALLDEDPKTDAGSPDWVGCSPSPRSERTSPSRPAPQRSCWTDRRLCTSSFVRHVP